VESAGGCTTAPSQSWSRLSGLPQLSAKSLRLQLDIDVLLVVTRLVTLAAILRR
jgi:hypothetical protein